MNKINSKTSKLTKNPYHDYSEYNAEKMIKIGVSVTNDSEDESKKINNESSYLFESGKNENFDIEFIVKKRLVCGASGNTYLGQLKNHKNKYLSIKHILKDSKIFKNSNDESFKKKVMNEIIINYNVSNRFIIKCLGYYSIGKDYVILQELAEKGNLRDFLQNFMNSYRLKTNNKLKVNTISESLSGYISYYIVRGLKHLFDLNVIHLDIKPENLLINSKNDILITDVTISEKLDNKSKYVFSGNGTRCYTSPENLLRKEVSCKDCHKSDLFSLGVLLYKYLYGFFPYQMKTSDCTQIILEKLTKNNLSFEIDTQLSTELKDLLSKLLEVNYEKRISIKDLMLHDWIKKFSSIKHLKENYSDLNKMVMDLYFDDIQL